MSKAKLIAIRPKPYRDAAATLHRIAQSIDDGKYGQVHTATLVLASVKGRTSVVEVFGLGEDSDLPSVITLLNIGAHRLVRALEEET